MGGEHLRIDLPISLELRNLLVDGGIRDEFLDELSDGAGGRDVLVDAVEDGLDESCFLIN